MFEFPLPFVLICTMLLFCLAFLLLLTFLCSFLTTNVDTETAGHFCKIPTEYKPSFWKWKQWHYIMLCGL